MLKTSSRLDLKIKYINKMFTKKQWYNEYKEDLILLYKKIMYVLKTRNLLYKDYSFNAFCDFVYKKTDHIL